MSPRELCIVVFILVSALDIVVAERRLLSSIIRQRRLENLDKRIFFFTSVSGSSFFDIPIETKRCSVSPLTLNAALPVGAATKATLFALNRVLKTAIIVWIRTLFPDPPGPLIVIISGLNWRISRHSIHSLILCKTIRSNSCWSWYNDDILYGCPSSLIGTFSLVLFCWVELCLISFYANPIFRWNVFIRFVV